MFGCSVAASSKSSLGRYTRAPMRCAPGDVISRVLYSRSLCCATVAVLQHPTLSCFGATFGSSPHRAHAQVRGWCQDSCLNRARQRRRHRRAIEDWAHLYDHALSADLAPAFQSWLPGSGWRWPARDGDDPQARALLLCRAVQEDDLRYWSAAGLCSSAHELGIEQGHGGHDVHGIQDALAAFTGRVNPGHPLPG